MQGRRDRGEEEERNRMQQKSGTGSIGLGGHKNLTWPGEENNPSTRNYGKKGAVRPINYWTLTEGKHRRMAGGTRRSTNPVKSKGTMHIPT